MSETEDCHVLTIGHSTYSFDRFIELLRLHQISAIADVRSSPFSRMNPQYNREPFARALKEAGVKYVFLGKELGARSDDPACYVSGKVQYELLANTKPFADGIQRVLAGARKHRIALMCAEKHPLDCHRCILVSPVLEALGASVSHILADGTVEPHAATMQKLLALSGGSTEDLFVSRNDLVKAALRKQEERIAYIDERLTAGERK